MTENMVCLMGYCSDCSKNGVMHRTWLYASVTTLFKSHFIMSWLCGHKFVIFGSFLDNPGWMRDLAW